jgi:hypothetical protein
MARYAVNNTLAGSQQNMGTGYKSIIAVWAITGATTLRRGWIDEFEVGADGAPNATDCQIVWDWSKMTADGTGTVATPNPMEGTDAAALLQYKVNYTANPTVTAATSLLTFAANQRAATRWQSRDKSEAIIIPATNLGGVVVEAKSTNYASTVIAHEYVTE